MIRKTAQQRTDEFTFKTSVKKILGESYTLSNEIKKEVLDFWSNWLVENPKKAFHEIAIAKHKNYVYFLGALAGYSFVACIFRYIHAGDIAKRFIEAGFPPGVFNVITGLVGVGARLVEHPNIDKVAFTGATDTGKRIAASAAKNLTRVSLELGGKSPNIVFEDADLDANDAVVLSYPFADTGNRHKDHDWLLEQCTQLGIPVLLDCAYFGICHGLEFDVRYPCITDLAFSLSKTFPVAHARIGMRLTRVDDDDPGFVLQKSGYVNRVSCGLGLHLIGHFSPDYIYYSYKQEQLDFCHQLGVEPSACIIFGIGDDKYQEYNRGTQTNRLSFYRYLHTRKLPDEGRNNL